MPTTTEAKIQYVPRQQRQYISKQTNIQKKYTLKSDDSVVKSINLNTLNNTSSTDSIVKSIDVNSLVAIPSKLASKTLWIALISIGTFAIVASVVTIPVVLTMNKANTVNTSTTTATRSTAPTTTTTFPYPSGILILLPENPLLNITNPSSSSPYYNISWLYYAQDYNETLTFAIQNNPSYTQIDDVSVLSGTQEFLCNGGFENASMICWQGANHLSTGNPHSGSYSYNDGVVGAPDYVWQTFNTVPGDLLYVSFWIAWGGSGGGVYMNVTMYP